MCGELGSRRGIRDLAQRGFGWTAINAETSTSRAARRKGLLPVGIDTRHCEATCQVNFTVVFATSDAATLVLRRKIEISGYRRTFPPLFDKLLKFKHKL